ncbi:MAG: response regulator [Candidatus Methanosuratus sp.]|nr:response regulator [Candidatus Methanosuratincola sp.]
MCKVLVVDDDPDFLEITRMVLEKEGYEVELASNGEQARKNLRASPPDIVLLDIMMDTVLEGLHISREIHESPDLQGCRVIMVTSIMGTEKAGLFPTDEYVPAEAWLTKPVQPDKLLEVVGNYCTHRTSG